MRSGNRAVRTLCAVVVCALGLALLPTVSGALGKTLYAAADGEKSGACSQAKPCEMRDAAELAKDGDSVSLAPGVYPVPVTGLSIKETISFGGTPGQAPLLTSGDGADLQVAPGANPTLHDFRLEGEGGLVLGSGVGERLFVSFTGELSSISEEPAACVLRQGTILRDSVCWAHSGAKTESEAHAIWASMGNEGPPGLVRLRNVTAVAENAFGRAIAAQAASGARFTLEGKNVIARADGQRRYRGDSQRQHLGHAGGDDELQLRHDRRRPELRRGHGSGHQRQPDRAAGLRRRRQRGLPRGGGLTDASTPASPTRSTAPSTPTACPGRPPDASGRSRRRHPTSAPTSGPRPASARRARGRRRRFPRPVTRSSGSSNGH